MSGAARVERDAALASDGNRTDPTAHVGRAPHGPDVGTAAIAGLVAEGLRVVQHDVAREQAEERARAALDLLVNVTHDLRSPLSSMLVLLEQLRGGAAGPVTAQQERLLALLYTAAFGMSTLTGDTLDQARGDLGALTATQAAPLSIRDIWERVRALVQPIVAERGLVLRYAGPQADRRLGHAPALHRILLNLVTNALKYTDRGGVTLIVTELPHDLVEFTVLDTGAPFPTAITEWLRHGAAPAHASGLGLAVCQRLLHDCGSRLTMRDDGDGKALSFVLSLPLIT